MATGPRTRPRIIVDEDSLVPNGVYDVDGLEWVPMEQPVINGETITVELAGVATALKQDTGNASLSAIDTKLLFQATATKQDTGNTSLGSIKTNTDPLVASGAGGYVRQDSTGTIAKESGGNLAALVAKDFSTETSLAAALAQLVSILAKLNATVNVVADLTKVNGSAIPVGDGIITANTLRVTIASDSNGRTRIIDNGTGVPVAINGDGDMQVTLGGETLTIRALAFATDKVDASGSSVNAGTNLNTSALSLEATQLDIRTALQIIDNFISGSRGLVTEDSAAAIKTAVELIDNAISGAGFNITQHGGVNAVTGSGTATGALRVELPTNGTGAIASITNPVTAVQTIAANLNMTEASAAAIRTALEIIDNIVSGAGINVTQFAGVNSASGSGTSAGALRVELPTDGTGVVRLKRSTTATTTTVADSVSSVTLLASNANRLGAGIANDSSAALYIKLGATASLTSYTARVTQYGYYEVPYEYTGIIDGIWATDPGDGAARIVELT